MLTAIHKETGAYIYGPDLSVEEGKALKGKIIDVFREDCFFRVGSTDKNGVHRRNHFVSTTGMGLDAWQEEFLPDDEIFKVSKNGRVSWNETAEHMAAKEFLLNKCISEGHYKPNSVKLEQRIKMPCGRIRIADVLAGEPGGPMLALEAQISPINFDVWRQRTLDYYSQGIDCQWWFGPKAITGQILEHERQYSTAVRTLGFTKD